MPGVNVIYVFATAVLVGVSLFFCVGTWRLSHGRGQVRPFTERAAMAIVFGIVGSQAMTWLQTSHPEASLTRYVCVWLQLVSAFGSAGLMLVQGWLSGPTRSHSPSPTTNV